MKKKIPLLKFVSLLEKLKLQKKLIVKLTFYETNRCEGKVMLKFKSLH